MTLSDDGLLSASTAAAYVAQRLQGVAGLPLDPAAPLEVREIGGGNLNYAYCVSQAGAPSRAVFVKQAPGFIKCLGPDFALSARRVVFESEVLREYGRLAPAHVPRHLLLDEPRHVLVLQYMDGYVLMREALLAGEVPARAAADLGSFMGATHRATHAALLGEGEAAALASRFENGTMCAITADYVFTKPLLPDDPTNRCSDALAPHAASLRSDAELKAAMLSMRSAFQTRRECLVHGDLHTGSVMVPAATAAAPDAPAVVIEYAPARLEPSTRRRNPHRRSPGWPPPQRGVCLLRPAGLRRRLAVRQPDLRRAPPRQPPRASGDPRAAQRVLVGVCCRARTVG